MVTSVSGDGVDAAVGRLGRHLLHIGILFIAAGTTVLAVTRTGAGTASTWDLAPGLFAVGASVGQLLGSPGEHGSVA